MIYYEIAYRKIEHVIIVRDFEVKKRNIIVVIYSTMNIKIVGAKFYQRMIYFSLFIKLFVIQYKTKNKP